MEIDALSPKMMFLHTTSICGGKMENIFYCNENRCPESENDVNFFIPSLVVAVKWKIYFIVMKIFALSPKIMSDSSYHV
jgi:hypothetical protein